MTTSTIKIKIGPVEVECEGTEIFLKEELPNILKTVLDLYKETGETVKDEHSKNKDYQDVQNVQNKDKESNIVGTTSSIAAKLKVKSGPDLIIAAASQLTFVQKREKFNRKDLFDEMRSASAYYKNSYGSNLTKYLNNLLKDGTLLETTKGNYAISATRKDGLLQSLS